MIIQQEKAQDREKLLLKFIKIMKVIQLKYPIFCVIFLFFNATTLKLLKLLITALKKVE